MTTIPTVDGVDHRLQSNNYSDGESASHGHGWERAGLIRGGVVVARERQESNSQRQE